MVMLAIATLFTLGIAGAACYDLMLRRVPNALNVTLLAMGLLVRLVLAGPSASLQGLAGMGLGLALLLVPFCAGWVGGGDVKLLAAIGAWLGPAGVLWTALFGLAGGGVLMAAILLVSSRALTSEVAATLRSVLYLRRLPRLERRRLAHTVPLAVPLAVAALAIFWSIGGIHA